MKFRYVKEFEFPSAGGFHGSNKMPSKARASERGMPGKVMRKAMGGPVAEITPSDGMNPADLAALVRAVQGAAGDAMPQENRFVMPPDVDPVTGRRKGPDMGYKGSPNEIAPGQMISEGRREEVGAPYEFGMAPQEPPYARAAQNPDRIAARRAAQELRAMMREDSARRPMPQARVAPGVRLPRDPSGGIATFAKGGKVAKVMREYKKGELHSGSKKGPKVTNPKQAMAIALSEARRTKKAEGGLTSYTESGSAGGSNVSFKEAFRKARQQGMKEFTWRGDRYTTQLKEETKRESKVEEQAPMAAETYRKGPQTRGGKRNVSEKSEVKSERKMELPSDRGTNFRSQAEGTGMSAAERAETARGYAKNLMGAAGAGSLLREPAKAGVKALARKASEFIGGRKMKKQAAEDAARKATPEYKKKSEQMEKFADEMRARQKMGRNYEEGGAVLRKGPQTRGTARKGRAQGRQDRIDRWALQRQRHAEKYAPGLSLDMPEEPMSKFAKGGSAKAAVHKHERAMHPGKPLTKLRRGGVPSHGRKPMYGGGKC